MSWTDWIQLVFKAVFVSVALIAGFFGVVRGDFMHGMTLLGVAYVLIELYDAKEKRP